MNFHEMIGLGIAGNFAGHLEQAGESLDFVGLTLKNEHAPKGIFPFYLPHHQGQLGVFPVSSNRIELPVSGENVQVEPEIALVCDILYNDDKSVDKIIPRFFGAFNDGSIRREGAKKISEKKNWGPTSKGIASSLVAVDTLDEGGVLDHYRLGCYLKREGEIYPYGVDSPCKGYTFFHDELLTWIVHQMNTQRDEGPLEDLSVHLKASTYPQQALICIGATRYTPFGEMTYLKKSDEVVVVAYPDEFYGVSLEDIAQMSSPRISVLTLNVC